MVVGTLIGTFLVDRLGRKCLLIFSLAAMTIIHVILGTYFFLQDSGSNAVENFGWVPVTSLFIFQLTYCIGMDPIPWLMISEIYSKDYNAIAGPANASFCFLMIFATTSTFGYISDAIGIGQTFWIFAGFCIVGILFSYFIVIETKAKSMADIQEMLAGKKFSPEKNAAQVQ